MFLHYKLVSDPPENTNIIWIRPRPNVALSWDEPNFNLGQAEFKSEDRMLGQTSNFGRIDNIIYILYFYTHHFAISARK